MKEQRAALYQRDVELMRAIGLPETGAGEDVCGDSHASGSGDRTLKHAPPTLLKSIAAGEDEIVDDKGVSDENVQELKQEADLVRVAATTHEDTSVVEATTTDEVGKRSSGMELKAAVEVDGRGDSNVSGFGMVTSKHAPRTLLEEQAE